MTPADAPARQTLLRRGYALEYVTLAWNVIGIVVLAIAAGGSGGTVSHRVWRSLAACWSLHER
jgi:hypothetical protein